MTKKKPVDKVPDEFNLRKRVTSAYFGKRFSEALEIWKKGDGERTQKEFVEGISNVNSIKDYKDGKTIPDPAIFKAMIEDRFALLDPPITIDFFLPTSDSELYADSVDYVSSLEVSLLQYANKIGLDYRLIEFLIKSTDFTELYPLWTPIKEHSAALLDPDKVEAHYRMTAAESRAAKIATDFRVGDKIISKIDLHVLKDLQDFLIRIIKLWYVERKREMDEEIKEADRLRQKKVNEAQKRNKGGWISDRDEVLTVGEMGEIDPYYKIWTKRIRANTSITDVVQKKKGKEE